MLIHELSAGVRDSGGRLYHAAVYARQRPDGLWEGWLEFRVAEPGRVLRTNRETVQSSERDMEVWATGLEPIYLEGAFERASRAADPIR
jgi:hypothetical protein